MKNKSAALPAYASSARASMRSDRQLDGREPARILRRAVLAACLCGAALAAHPAHAGTVSYSYDTLGRLASAVYSDGSATTTITYSYDAAGNRMSVAATSS